MQAGLEKVMHYKGYVVIVMKDGDINIYRQGNFVLHAKCSIMDSDEETLEMVEELLVFKESIEHKSEGVAV